MKTARQTAVEALMKLNKDSGYSNLVLDAALEKSELSPRDKGFCTALFYGVLERRLTIDAVLARYCKQPLKKLMPQVRELLRVAVYQILYLDGVPASAAVNESVNLSKKMKCGHAAGFLNGVLRSFLRDGGNLDGVLPDPAEDPVGWLSLSYSAPRWLVELWREDYGPEAAEGILRAAVGRPPMYLRVNPMKITPEELIAALEQKGVEARERPDLPGCLEATHPGEIDYLVLYKRGAFFVQDAASQLCAWAVDPRPGMRVLDCCAAPGGKSFSMAMRMEDQGEIMACDLYDFKAKLVADGAKRLGLSCIHARVGDGAEHHPDWGTFDRVLCDVPCSGLGVIRRKPEIRYKDPADLEGLPNLQYKILEISSSYVKKGGRLVYSTCTLRRAENDEVADRFLREHPEFIPASLPPEVLSAAGAEEGASRLTLFPAMLGSDGFFMAAFQRSEEGTGL